MSSINQTLIDKYKNEKFIIKTLYADSSNQIIDGIVNPFRIDNRQIMAPTDNQGSIPGCAGWSACTLAESIFWKKTGKLIQLDAAQVYAKAKTLDGQPKVDGTYLEASLQAAIELCAFDKKYKIGTFYNNKNKENVIETVKFLIHKYDFLQVGFTIDEGWYSCNNENYILKAKGRCLGGHAVNICGYDDIGFYILNQWGVNWGSKGYGIMPYDLFFQEFMYCTFVYD